MDSLADARAARAGHPDSPGRVRVAATLAGLPPAGTAALPALPPEVDFLEVRADLVGDLDPAALRHRFGGALTYCLRGGGERRRERLLWAAQGYDLVELDASTDLDPVLLDRIPPDRRVLSWSGPAAGLAELRGRVEAMAAVGARTYRVATAATTAGEALLPLRLLRSLRRTDVSAHAEGTAGTWTRLLAARYGAPVVSGWLDLSAGPGQLPAGGELALARLLRDYQLAGLDRATRSYGIIGGSTAGSLSPRVHNTAYHVLGLAALFLPFSTPELGRSLAELRDGLDELGLPLHAATVIAPHKEHALGLASDATPVARRVGAASLLVRREAGWWADNEAEGVVATLASRRVPLAGRAAAVIGCGGAGRAAAAGLARAGARVTLVNRGVDRGRYAAALLGLPFVPLAEFDAARYQVVVHATTVKDRTPFPLDGLGEGSAVLDLNYRTTETPLIADARERGHVVIDGLEMLVAELSRQFHLMTGQWMPVGQVRAALGLDARRPPP